MSTRTRPQAARPGALARRGVVPMVLAAGRATRLRPLTDQRAKAVVPFLNRPLLDYTLDWLARSGFERVVINLHHAADSIRERYGPTAFGMDVEFSHEPRLLGTGGGPRKALDRLGDHVLLVNGDVLTLAALGPLARHHFESGAVATLGLYSGATGRDYPQVAATPEGRLAAFPDALDEAPAEATVRGVFCGIHLLRREALELLPEGVFAGTVNHLYRPLLAAGLELGAVALPGSWYEIGDPSRYIEHQLHALTRGACPLAIRRVIRWGEAAYTSVDTHLESTRMKPPYLVGPGARIKDGARLRGCVIADRVRVEVGAWLRECVVWADAEIGPGARLERCVVMEGVRVPAETLAREQVFTPQGPLPFGAARSEPG